MKRQDTGNEIQRITYRKQEETNRKRNYRSGLAFFILCGSLFAGTVLQSCNGPYVPKPTGYFNISFPEKKYRLFDEPGYPYSFEYPLYSDITKDSAFFDSTTENPYWINVNFPRFNGRIYISYKAIGKYKVAALVNDAYNMTGKHTSQASGIDDSLMTTPNGLHGVFFSVQGDVATANQFFVTDSTQHFLRGALYFDATPNEDSLRPVNDFLESDIRHLINTLRWK